MLLDNPVATIKTCHTLNPATLLPREKGALKHDCIETIDTIYFRCPDLGSEPFPNAEEEWFTDGSSFMREVKSLAGYTVIEDISHRSKNPILRDFCTKGGVGSHHLRLRAWDREDLKCLHRFPVCI